MIFYFFIYNIKNGDIYEKEKIIIICIIFVLIFIGLIGFYFFDKQENNIHFYVNNKEIKSYSASIEYGKEIDFKPETINLQAKKGNTNITDKLSYKKIKYKKLGKYSIDYQYKTFNRTHTFTYNIEVVDTSAPTISFDDEIHVKLNDSFDINSIEAKANDNYDKDISDKIKRSGEVNTSIPNTYEVTLTVEDSSHNIATKIIKVIVDDEEKVDVKEVSESVEVKKTISTSDPNNITVLINKNHSIPLGWAPSDLVYTNGVYLRSEVANAYNKLKAAANASGVGINAVSGYRSYETQVNLYNSYMATDPANAPYYSAKPRTSEHELGLAIDISYDSALHADLQNSSLGMWMSQHAHEYGFILRYPNGKTASTGYIFEAWHYRYVGTGLASTIKNSGMTLEEYYGE